MLHVALRAPKDAVIKADGKNVVPEVWNVLDKIKDFSDKIRSGSWVSLVDFNFLKPLTLLFLCLHVLKVL